MSFLNPSILLGLFAVAIPILIHLLNLRKIRKVEFSTLMFLKEIQKSKMRRIKLKQIILLLLRIFTIVFLVLCFAKPVYEGFAGSKNNSSSSTVLIFIDNSFSMAARDNKGSYLSQAKESVKKILESHKESDDIYLIPSSDIGLKGKKILYDNFKEILDSLEKVKISYRSLSIDEILNTSDLILSSSKNPGKEIFIISDFQKNNFNTTSIPTGGLTNLSDKQVNTYLIKTGSREVKNISLDSFVTVSKILEKDKDIKIKIYITNHSQYNVKNKTVNLYIDNELKGEKVIDINSFEKKEVEFAFKSNKAGNINGTIELVQSEFQDDEIIQDNKYFFSMYIPEKFNIGLIGDNSKDYYFINLALQTASTILSDSIKRKSELFNINYNKTIDEGISKNDVVFISNIKSFSDDEANILKNYISMGGGVFLFLGNSVDISNYNNTIFSKLNTARIDKLNTAKELNSSLKFDKIDFENPVLSEVFQNQKLNITSDKFNIESPEINFYYELLPNQNVNPVITFTNNKPFLLESSISKGKILISSLAATDDFSNLPLKTIFVPLIVRSIYYLSNNFEIQKEYIAGNSNLVSVIGLKNISGITMPDNSIIKPGIKFASPSENYLLLPYSDQTSEVGNYTIEDSSGAKYNFALNVNARESNPESLNNDEILDYFKKNKIANVKFIESDENIQEVVNQSRSGFSLWKYFLFGAILFIAAELLLSKKIEKG